MPRPPTGLAQALEAVARTARSRPHKAPPGTRAHGSPLAHRILHTHATPAVHAPASGSGSTGAGTAARGALRSFVKLLSDGVFTTIKSSAYKHPHGPYSTSRLVPSPVTNFARGVATRRSVVNARSPSFGPVAPLAGFGARSTVRNVGLGQARGFASGGSAGVWNNVVQNVPLGLRALGNQGIDERKWKRVRRDVRKADLKSRRSTQGRQQALPRGLFVSKDQEWAKYFGRASDVATVAAIVEQQQQQPERLPVVLIIQVEPDLSFADLAPGSASASASFTDPSAYRLLSPGVVSHFHTITSAYEAHAHRIKSLHRRLVEAGAFDDPDTRTEAVEWREFDGRVKREVHVTFGPGWTRGDVKNAVGMWRADADWYRVVDLEEEHEAKMRQVRTDVLFDETETSESADESCSRLSGCDSQMHRDVVDTFVLPVVDYLSVDASSLEVTPEHSPAPSEHWDEVERVSLTDTVSVASDGFVDCPWTSRQDEMCSSYELGVHNFLRDIDDARARL